MPLLSLFEKLSAKTGSLSPILTPQRLMRTAAALSVVLITCDLLWLSNPLG